MSLTPDSFPSENPKAITVQDLDQLIAQISAKREEIEKSEAVTTGLNKELALLKAKAVNYLKELGRENFQSPHGTVRVSQKWRVNLPKTDDGKAALFEWMRGQGIFDMYATVNSNSLNALYMAEWEAAKKRGEGLEFSMPGIDAPKLFEDLSYSKARKGE
jgi:hypothetical protein